MSTIGKIAIGAGVAAGAYLIWRKYFSGGTPCGCSGAAGASEIAPSGVGNVATSLTPSGQVSSNLGSSFLTAGLLPPAQTVGPRAPRAATTAVPSYVANPATLAMLAPKPAAPAPQSFLHSPVILGGVQIEGSTASTPVN